MCGTPKLGKEFWKENFGFPGKVKFKRPWGNLPETGVPKALLKPKVPGFLNGERKYPKRFSQIKNPGGLPVLSKNQK